MLNDEDSLLWCGRVGLARQSTGDVERVESCEIYGEF